MHSLAVYQRVTLKAKCKAIVNLEIKGKSVIKIEYSIIKHNIYEKYTVNKLGSQPLSCCRSQWTSCTAPSKFIIYKSLPLNWVEISTTSI